MKKLLTLVLLASTLVLVMNGCKKGSQDPFISFRSREARLCGKWNVTKYTRNTKDMLTRSDTTMTGAPMGSCGWLTHKDDTLATITFQFYTDGRYEARGDSVYLDNYQFSAQAAHPCNDTTYKVEQTNNFGGTWTWGGSGGSYKKEEILLLSDYNHIDSHAWKILGLKYKEITLERAVTDSVSGKSTIYDMTLERTK